MFWNNRAPARTEQEELALWLRRTAQNLKRGELPPESWELDHSPFADAAVRRRIAALISRIAEKTDYRRN